MIESSTAPRAVLLALALVTAPVALGAAGCLSADAAETLPDDPRADVEWLRGDADERAAWDALGAGKAIRARELAERSLDAHPGSFLGTWVLSQVMHLEEGHHARARFLLRRARTMLERRFGTRPADQLAKQWHKRVIEAESELLGEMELRNEQLAVIAEHDALYAPSLKGSSIWALMKLGRFDEAIKTAESLMYSDELWERISAYNGMMAVYDEMRDKSKSFEWGTRGIEVTQGRHCILLHNTAQSALQMFRFKDAEEFARRSTRAEYDDCPSSTYEHLVTLYLHLGEYQKAISSYKKVVSHAILPRYRPMFDKNNKALLAEILYALGKYEDGLEYARIVFSAPDRVGMVSLSVEDIRFGHGVIYWLLLDARIRELRAEASVRGFAERMEMAWKLKKLEIKQWEIQRILSTLSVHKDLLVVNLRPFMRGVKPWYAGALARIFGAGIATAALDEARALDAPHLDGAGMAFFDAVEAEYALVGGDAERARELAQQALAKLAPESAVLVARTQAVLVAANRELGDGTDSPEMVALLKGILQRFPAIVHQLDLRLPVSVTHDGAPLAEKAAALFHDHDRFETGGDAPFGLSVAAPKEGTVEICLRSADGFRFGCKDSTFERDEPENAEKAVHAFVADVLSPRIELTSSDVNSLDGSPVRQTADEALKGVLKTKVIKEDDE